MAYLFSRTLFDFVGKSARSEVLEAQMSEAGFWDNPDAAQGVIRELKTTKRVADGLGSLASEVEDLYELAEMVDGDEEQEAQVLLEVESLEARYESFELEALFVGAHDQRPALLTIQAGNGGTDANDFADMLFRMYKRWADAENLDCEVVDITPNDEAGIKMAQLKIKGEYAYGRLKAEMGVHRLIRISPFNSAGKRQTSFVGIDVIPELDEAGGIEILDKDLRIDTYRAGGKGGQHVNTSDSAVRITHLPTGVVVQCQNQRSQHKNRAAAMIVLKGRLARLQEMEREKEVATAYDAKGEIAFGSQIRTYTLQPYTLVKDHRTNTEVGNVAAVLDGRLNDFIEAWLRSQAKKREVK
ncbi:MAG: peptide chain release factor 2 [Planctomycetota bacterium]